jgi:hypothetical protein
MHFQRDHAAGKADALAVVLEHRRQHGQAAVVQQVGVVVA